MINEKLETIETYENPSEGEEETIELENEFYMEIIWQMSMPA